LFDNYIAKEIKAKLQGQVCDKRFNHLSFAPFMHGGEDQLPKGFFTRFVYLCTYCILKPCLLCTFCDNNTKFQQGFVYHYMIAIILKVNTVFIVISLSNS